MYTFADKIAGGPLESKSCPCWEIVAIQQNWSAYTGSQMLGKSRAGWQQKWGRTNNRRDVEVALMKENPAAVGHNIRLEAGWRGQWAPQALNLLLKKAAQETHRLHLWRCRLSYLTLLKWQSCDIGNHGPPLIPIAHHPYEVHLSPMSSEFV